MRYSLDQLEIFSAVVEAGSFSAAARRQQRTQSSVSAAIANLEADLGVLLFDAAVTVPIAGVLGVPTLAVGMTLVAVQFGYRMLTDPHEGRRADSGN